MRDSGRIHPGVSSRSRSVKCDVMCDFAYIERHLPITCVYMNVANHPFRSLEKANRFPFLQRLVLFAVIK
jgi:hypothetical protein